jgi:ApaG protein
MEVIGAGRMSEMAGWIANRCAILPCIDPRKPGALAGAKGRRRRPAQKGDARVGKQARQKLDRSAAQNPPQNFTRIPMAAYELTVSVSTKYLDNQSDPEHASYVFAYTITIRNTGQVAAQVISRHWVITDAENHIEQVRGLGVVGHQPLLQPGEEFEYTSGTSLPTPHGTMFGEYFCVAEDGERFEAPIPEFVLSLPRTLH